MSANISSIPGSFRDPSGFVFYSGETLLRSVNRCYADQYDHLMKSGLYDEAVQQRLLIPHREVPPKPVCPPETYRLLQPTIIPFISYPYEWCFSQLKDAALTVIHLQQLAMEYGMTLKDAPAYNIQFLKGRPVWIDTLSFEKYNRLSPWAAYQQFCQHFLAPLSLMAWSDFRLIHLMKSNIDGIPLSLASSLLPTRTWLNSGILFHVHLHARSQRKNTTIDDKVRSRTISQNQILGLLDHLEATIQHLSLKKPESIWVDYYNDNNYTRESEKEKERLVLEYLLSLEPGVLWDFGGNIGNFSHMAASNGFECILFDNDHGCIERCYTEIKKSGEEHILPLYMDLSNPSPGIGWRNEERTALLKRPKPDTILALALIHHLAIGNSVPLKELARFFGEMCDNLIIEFVPKSDDQVQRLLLVRQDIFSEYTKETFEREFSRYFVIKRRDTIKNSERILYLMRRK